MCLVGLASMFVGLLNVLYVYNSDANNNINC